MVYFGNFFLLLSPGHLRSCASCLFHTFLFVCWFLPCSLRAVCTSGCVHHNTDTYSPPVKNLFMVEPQAIGRRQTPFYLLRNSWLTHPVSPLCETCSQPPETSPVRITVSPCCKRLKTAWSVEGLNGSLQWRLPLPFR